MFALRLDETSPLYRHVASSRIHVHLACFPTEGLDAYEASHYGGADPSSLKGQARNESKYFSDLYR